MRIIDLSLPLESLRSDPRVFRNQVTYQDHTFGARAIRLLYGLPRRLLPRGLGWANETIRLSTHGTTHVDAPYHYGPVSGGRPARTIDKVPLEWCFCDGVVLDMRHKKTGEVITVADLEAELARIAYTLKPLDIVLLHTGADAYYGTPEYFTRGTGLGRESTLWLVERGVKMIGIDAWGLDIPLKIQAKRAKRANDSHVFWEAHFAGTEREYCQLERLAHLDRLPSFGFKVACFPLNIPGAGAGPARVVAILDA